MIPDYHFYHGAALSTLVSRTEFAGLTRMGTSAYAVNNIIGLYIKHASKRSSPWQFTFSPDNQRDVRSLFQRYDRKTFIALVCGHHGICLLTYGEYAATLSEDFTNQRVLTVRRPPGGGFRVSGSAGNRLNGVVALNRYPRELFQ